MFKARAGGSAASASTAPPTTRALTRSRVRGGRSHRPPAGVPAAGVPGRSQAGRRQDRPVIERALAYLRAEQEADGGNLVGDLKLLPVPERLPQRRARGAVVALPHRGGGGRRDDVEGDGPSAGPADFLAQ